MISLNFILTALVVVLIPGTGVLYTINTGLTRSSMATLAAAMGCTLGILPHMIACILGLSAVMHISAEIFMGIKMLGVGYLFYLAWKTWTSAGSLTFQKEKSHDPWIRIATKGILLNVLNPKLTLFFFSFLPQFIPAESTHQMSSMLILSSVFMLMTLIVFIAYGLLAHQSQGLLKKKNLIQNIEKGFAGLFAGLALKLALEND